MIYIPTCNWAFCHVPRTGGTALHYMIKQAFPDAVIDGTRKGAHRTVSSIRAQYQDVRIFSIIRNPWRIWESNYGWIRRYGGVAGIDDKMSWDYYFDAHIAIGWPCKPPGFYATFLDETVWVFKYEEKPLPLIEQILGRSIPSWVQNETVHEPPTWTPRQVEIIRKHCSDDIERFGYSVPNDIKIA